MGDSTSSGGAGAIHNQDESSRNAHPEVIRDGELLRIVDAAPIQNQDETRSLEYPTDGKRHWFRVNVRSADGALLIVGNPIYVNF
jgi:hypothetical protein